MRRMIQREDTLLDLARRYCEAKSLALATVSTRAAKDGKCFLRLENGGAVGKSTYEHAMRWFSQHWPPETEWPEEVERPPVETEHAA